MNFNIGSEKEAKKALEFFNSFHDSFIKSLTIISRDEFQRDKSQICTGEFDVYIEFAHHNYKEGKTNYQQIVEVKLFNVSNFYLDLREIKTTDWSVNDVKILACKRETNDGTRACLEFEVSMSQMVADQWVPKTYKLFDFEAANFSERET